MEEDGLPPCRNVRASTSVLLERERGGGQLTSRRLTEAQAVGGGGDSVEWRP